jgi:hypothetical protein
VHIDIIHRAGMFDEIIAERLLAVGAYLRDIRRC